MAKNITFLLCFFYLGLSAQQYYNDAQLWASVDVKKKVSKRFDIHLKLQARGTSNVTVLGRSYADIGVIFKLNKNIKFLGDYVYGKKARQDNSYKTQHFYSVAIVLKKDIGHFTLMYRNMLQSRYTNSGTSKYGYIPRCYDRNKLTVKYEATKRLSFYVAGEINIPLNDPQFKGISRSRSYIGTDINVTKNQQLELYFMYQAKYENSDWFDQEKPYPNDPLKRYYVYGVTYSIDF